MNKENYVWYASYGSNLSKSRFYCYIKGGKPEGSNITESGCRDMSLPLDDKKLILNNELLFVEKSKRWGNKGVAIIDTKIKPSIKTYGRMYLITKDQFIDVVKQENGIKVEESLNVNFPKHEKGSSEVLFKNKRYGRIVYVGEELGHPIFTFTTSVPIEDCIINQPSEEYLKMIANGIYETYKLSSVDIAKYFIGFEGVQGNYKLNDLINIFNNLND